MLIEQGELIEVNCLLPDDKFRNHPVVVLSNSDINEYEGACICAMISGITTNDAYSFWLDESMLTKPAKKKCQVRCQLIMLVPENQIIQRISKVKKHYLKQIIDKIISTTFNIDE